MPAFHPRRFFRALLGIPGVLVVVCVLRGGAAPPGKLDPASWGSDHVGKPVPEYTTGDECLFCHRTDVGPSWTKNRHQRTVREIEPASPALTALKGTPEFQSFAGEVALLLGDGLSTRFLKRSATYGKVDLLTVAFDTPAGASAGKLRPGEGKPRWDNTTFAEGCAGCHTTAVDPTTKAFAAVALDCFACHGVVPGEHSNKPQLAYFSKKRNDPARVVTSLCASCHIRNGKSKTTGLPYPDNFVVGDNLFRDFQVDLSPDAIAALNPGDRHVLENVRDVVVLGKEEVTCLSCHDIHKQSSRKHTRVAEDDSCVTCHNDTGSKKKIKSFEVHSKVCQY
jgi:predicted CXXCH cytochrome family protein